MSDAPKRTLAEVHQEYSRLCAQLGHLRFNRSQMESDEAVLLGQLREINQEAIALSAAEKAASDAAAPAVGA